KIQESGGQQEAGAPGASRGIAVAHRPARASTTAATYAAAYHPAAFQQRSSATTSRFGQGASRVRTKHQGGGARGSAVAGSAERGTGGQDPQRKAGHQGACARLRS